MITHDGGSKLHGESTRGRVKGKVVSEDLHDVVTVGGELLEAGERSAKRLGEVTPESTTHSDDDHGSSKDEDPDGDGVLRGGELSSGPDLVDGGVGTDGVGDLSAKRTVNSLPR